MSKTAEAFRTISEVADELDVPKHVLRFWEGRFPQIKPMKRGGGRRYYRPEDLALLRGICHLLHAEGYTIKGVQKILREQGIDQVKQIGLQPRAKSAPSAMAGKRGRPAVRPSGSVMAPAGATTAPPGARLHAAAVMPDIRSRLVAAIAELEVCRSMLLGKAIEFDRAPTRGEVAARRTSLIADAKTVDAAPIRVGAMVGDELWCVDLASAAAALAQMERRVSRLSPDDVETARAIADPAAAADWLTARAGLRLLLERAAGSDFRGAPLKRTPHGKPRLEGAGVAFSLSHVKGLALIGLARAGVIGVDLERTRAVRVAPERRGRIEAAGAALNAGALLPDAGEARFLQAWVRLESFAKADGGGIGRLLTRLGLIGGGGDASEDAIAARVAEVRAAMAGVATHDVALGENLFAAVTLASGRDAPPLRWLPSDVNGLAALLS